MDKLGMAQPRCGRTGVCLSLRGAVSWRVVAAGGWAAATTRIARLSAGSASAPRIRHIASRGSSIIGTPGQAPLNPISSQHAFCPFVRQFPSARPLTTSPPAQSHFSALTIEPPSAKHPPSPPPPSIQHSLHSCTPERPRTFFLFDTSAPALSLCFAPPHATPEPAVGAAAAPRVGRSLSRRRPLRSGSSPRTPTPNPQTTFSSPHPSLLRRRPSIPRARQRRRALLPTRPPSPAAPPPLRRATYRRIYATKSWSPSSSRTVPPGTTRSAVAALPARRTLV